MLRLAFLDLSEEFQDVVLLLDVLIEGLFLQAVEVRVVDEFVLLQLGVLLSPLLMTLLLFSFGQCLTNLRKEEGILLKEKPSPWAFFGE